MQHIIPATTPPTRNNAGSESRQYRRIVHAATHQLAIWCQQDEARAVRVATLMAAGSTLAQAVRAVRLSDALTADSAVVIASSPTF